MRYRSGLIALAAGVALTSTGIAKAPTGTLDIPPDGTITITAKDAQANIVVTPIGLRYPVFNPAFAARADLSSGLLGIFARVGNTTVRGHTTVVNMTVGGVDNKRRSLWFERPIAPDRDGLFGPSALPQPIVTFHLRTPEAGERQIVLPLVEEHFIQGTSITLNGTPVFVSWDLQQPRAIGTAAVGQLLATTQGGAFHGGTSATPIRFGILRPTRALVLDRPLTVGGTILGSLLIRTTDHGDASGIADADTQGDGDESEIVVTGKKKGSKPIYTMTIGRDEMAGCSSITFDQTAKQIRLSCRT